MKIIKPLVWFMAQMVMLPLSVMLIIYGWLYADRQQAEVVEVHQLCYVQTDYIDTTRIRENRRRPIYQPLARNIMDCESARLAEHEARRREIMAERRTDRSMCWMANEKHICFRSIGEVAVVTLTVSFPGKALDKFVNLYDEDRNLLSVGDSTSIQRLEWLGQDVRLIQDASFVLTPFTGLGWGLVGLAFLCFCALLQWVFHRVDKAMGRA